MPETPPDKAANGQFRRLSEPLRCAYLEAMGISQWRWQAPAEAPSSPPELSVQPPESDAKVEPPMPSPAGAEFQAPPAMTPASAAEAEARPAAAPAPASVAATEPNPPPAQITPLVEVVSANASSAPDWPRLRAEVAACVACDLHQTRTQTVFGVGNEKAELMIIGEAPGAEEDRVGEPFVGAAGRLLNEMLAAIGLEREQVFIANIIKCRPPGNRDPKAEEVAACAGYLQQQIDWIRPRLILVVGRIAAQHCLASDAALGSLRGRMHVFGEARIPLLATYHPAYLLRSPAHKRKAWQDLKRVRQQLVG